ncbi:hypothetical protein EYC58_01120 [Candidatus Saccharibacteria bacterium]|nr:MAG: hypothetical protein EYC58_01120 [Candidatus Saccharibacteria bacterium]
MTEPRTAHTPKPAGYWAITILCWGMVIFLIGMAVWSLMQGDIRSFIGFLLFAAYALATMYPPKWLQRFARH